MCKTIDVASLLLLLSSAIKIQGCINYLDKNKNTYMLLGFREKEKKIQEK